MDRPIKANGTFQPVEMCQTDGEEPPFLGKQELLGSPTTVEIWVDASSADGRAEWTPPVSPFLEKDSPFHLSRN